MSFSLFCKFRTNTHKHYLYTTHLYIKCYPSITSLTLNKAVSIQKPNESHTQNIKLCDVLEKNVMGMRPTLSVQLQQTVSSDTQHHSLH